MLAATLPAIAKEDAEYNHMPDYQIRIDDQKDQLIARSRGTVGEWAVTSTPFSPIKSEPFRGSFPPAGW